MPASWTPLRPVLIKSLQVSEFMQLFQTPHYNLPLSLLSWVTSVTKSRPARGRNTWVPRLRNQFRFSHPMVPWFLPHHVVLVANSQANGLLVTTCYYYRPPVPVLVLYSLQPKQLSKNPFNFKSFQTDQVYHSDTILQQYCKVQPHNDITWYNNLCKFCSTDPTRCMLFQVWLSLTLCLTLCQTPSCSANSKGLDTLALRATAKRVTASCCNKRAQPGSSSAICIDL